LTFENHNNSQSLGQNSKEEPQEIETGVMAGDDIKWRFHSVA